MKLIPKKINLISAAVIGINVVFLLIIAYEGYFVFNLYNALNQDAQQDFTKHVVRVDFKMMDDAVKRYQASSSYSVPVTADGKPSFNDPFSNPVTIPAAH